MKFYHGIFAGVVFCTMAFCGVSWGANPDNREKADWSKYPQIVLLRTAGTGTCTGQYVAPNLILTAAHCAPDDVSESTNFYVCNYKTGNANIIRDCFYAHMVSIGDFKGKKNYTLANAGVNDWMFLKIQDKQYYCPECVYDMYKSDNSQGYVAVESVGFGGMKILEQSDIDKLKGVYKKQKRSELAVQQVQDEVPGLFNDGKNLKKSSCEILYDVDCSVVCKKKGWFRKQKQDAVACDNVCGGKEGITPYRKNYPNVLYTTCYTVPGNSGGAFVTNNDALVAILSGGDDFVYYSDKQTYLDIAVNNIQFAQKLQELKTQYPVDVSELCTAEELAVLGAKGGVKKDGKCVVVHKMDCLDDRYLNTTTGKCEIFDWTSVSCLEEELKELHAVKGVNNPQGKCVPTECDTEYDLKDDTCVEKSSKPTPVVEQNVPTPVKAIVNTGETSVSKTGASEEHDVVVTPGNSINIEPMPGLDVVGMLSNMNQTSTPVVAEIKYDNKALEAAIASLETKKSEAIAETDNAIKSAQESGMDDTDVVIITSQLGVIHDYDERIKKLEEAYSQAKERENSLVNRMLSGATIAATGLGGMELARGLAEKKADENAEADMAAYMATFQCKIGDNGNKINGGDMEIATPGANQLINLYQSYVDLAASVKQRKADLGIRAGIESDVVLDKSATGLYDDKGNGVQNGTYASLYRAAMGNEADIDKLAEQSDATTRRAQIGGASAGVGAIGGAIGNALINGGDDKSGVGNFDISSLKLDTNTMNALKTKFGDKLRNMDVNQIMQAVQSFEK